MDLRTEPTFNVLALCAGVAGEELGLGLALSNARTVCHVDIEAHACEILASRMEDKVLDEAPIWTDLKSFDSAKWRGVIDCITGGYPCQPFSVAGRRAAEADPRHLWPFIADIVRAIQPGQCFFENVSNHINLGFDNVARDLQEMGYRVAAGLFTAEEVGAPHKRERLFILADCHGYRFKGSGVQLLQRGSREALLEPDRDGGDVADPQSSRRRSSDVVRGCSEQGLDGRGEKTGWLGKLGSLLAHGFRPRLEERRREPGDDGSECEASQRGCVGQADAKLGDSESDDKCRSRSGEGGCKSPVGGSSVHVADGNSKLHDGSGESGAGGRFELANRSYVFPPGPANLDRWADILEQDLSVAPALSETEAKSELYRLADGMADRMERLSRGGNGCVSLVAGYAYCVLSAALRETQ